jgi:topoisomerase-4 subunit A
MADDQPPEQPELFAATELGLAPVDTGASEEPVDSPLRTMFDSHFLQYASYVIRDRAIPHLADGLKPVQRRILHALFEKDDGRFVKVANIVGHAMQYHPHGDASITDALVGLVNRRFLIEGQGNFGNLLTGDPAAASRYIECRLTELAREEIFNPALTDFIPSYDGRNREPVTLPSRLPLLLMMGAEGIAVGLSTRLLPHNFGELLEAQMAILRNKPFAVLPDFQQGGLMDASEYADGNGRVRLRARIEIRSPTTLVIREIPCGTTTDQLIASIEAAAFLKKIPVKTLTDFTADQVEIELALTPEADAQKAIQALFAFTECEITLSVRAIVIQDRRPVEMSVSSILQAGTEALVVLLRRELRHALTQLTEALHFKTLIEIFIGEGLYRNLEQCETLEAMEQTIREGLIPFRDRLQRDLTQKDIEQLLELKIRRIARFDLDKNREELAKIRTDIGETRRNLDDLTSYALATLRRLHRKFAAEFPRRTEITTFAGLDLKAITARELNLVYDRTSGYLGSDLKGAPLLSCSSYDKLLLVWADGRYRVISPPEKLFVDKNLLYCRPYDRDQVFTLAYTDSGITYLKRFTPGGVITQRDYRCGPDGAQVVLLDETGADKIYVRYQPSEKLKIRQQIFLATQAPVQTPKNAGAQMTVKAIEAIDIKPLPDWDQYPAAPAGKIMKP